MTTRIAPDVGLAARGRESPMQGFEAIAELIRRSGVETVFSMLGSTNIPWIGYGVESGAFGLVKTRHEETCVAAAVGYSKTTGLLGVCGVTRGPGFANSVNALTAATRSHVPLIVLVGESSDDRATQNLNQEAITHAVGAGFTHVPHAAELEHAYWEAVTAAHFSGRPQVISIADIVLEEATELIQAAPEHRRLMHHPDDASIAAAVDLLSTSSKPLILAGQGAVLSRSRKVLIELADLCGASLANTLNANRFFSGHDRDLGLCGSWSPQLARDRIALSDVVLAFGASLNKHTMAEGLAFAGAHVVHCEIDADAACRASSPDLAILGDATQTAQAIIDEWNRRGLGRREALSGEPSRDEIMQSLLVRDLGHQSDRGLDLRLVYRAFDSLLAPDRIVVSDAGRHLGVLPSLVNARDARSWITSRGYGSVGLGLGAAIGAAAANPDRQVALFCGDGGFMMAAQELDTIRFHELSVLIVVMNDGQYGAEVSYLDKYGIKSGVVRWSLPDVVKLADAFDGVGIVVDSPGALDSLELPSSGLVIIDVRIDPDVDGGGSSFLGAFG